MPASGATLAYQKPSINTNNAHRRISDERLTQASLLPLASWTVRQAIRGHSDPCSHKMKEVEPNSPAVDTESSLALSVMRGDTAGQYSPCSIAGLG